MKPTPVQNPSPLVISGARRRTSYKFCQPFSLLVLFLFLPACFYAQADSIGPGQKSIVIQRMDTTIKPTHYYFLTREQKTKRQWIIGGLNLAGYGASIIIFNNTWYKDFPKTSFHTFNDSREWLQMDKMGHVWAAYNAGRASAAMWRWAGVSPNKATWIGGASSIAYLTVIEILDGRSAKWGWSWSDMIANLAGSGLFVSQQLGWQEQRVQVKFSFHYKNYSDPMLKERSDNLFGSSWVERMLKDYNGQTYWLSTNLKSFFPRSDLPAWLNVAIGYGAEGMFGGFENRWTDDDSGIAIDRTDIKRYRQWYLAPDVNFSKIKTNKKAVRVLFDVLDAFKFPAPGLELSNNKIKLRAIHF